MDNSEIIPYVLIAILIQCLLLYWIIVTALKSAGFSQAKDIKMLLRMKAKQMKKQGFTYQEIYDLFVDSEDDFWQKLKDQD